MTARAKVINSFQELPKLFDREEKMTNQEIIAKLDEIQAIVLKIQQRVFEGSVDNGKATSSASPARFYESPEAAEQAIKKLVDAKRTLGLKEISSPEIASMIRRENNIGNEEPITLNRFITEPMQERLGIKVFYRDGAKKSKTYKIL